MKKAVFAAFLLLILIVTGFWIVAVPEQFLIDLIEHSVPWETMYLKMEGFRKGLFYNFYVDEIVLMKRAKTGENATMEQGGSGGTDRPLFMFKDVNGQINLLSIVKLNPQLSIGCSLHGGVIAAEVGLMGTGTIRMKGHGVRIRKIPFLEDVGIRGEGNLSAELRLRDAKGELKIAVDDARFENTSLGGFFVPLGLFHEVKGLMAIQGKTLLIQSLTFQGNGVYARGKGAIEGNNLNIGLEIVTDSSFQSEPVLLTMLEQYKVSPGYYLIPLKAPL